MNLSLTAPCITPGCGRVRDTVSRSHYCGGCRGRKQRYGAPEKPSVTRQRRVWNPNCNVVNGYLTTWFCGIKAPVHRLVYLITYGEIPKGYHIHHKDGNRFNNHWDNLVAVTPLEHCRLHKRMKHEHT